MEIMTSGGFNQIPADERASGFLAEVDGSKAGTFTQAFKAVILSQKTAAGTASAAVPTLVPGEDGAAADALFGAGSLAALMCRAFKRCAPYLTLYCIALDDDAAGVAATLEVTITGPATAAGTLALYIAERRVRVAVASGDAAADVVAAVVAAINADAQLPVAAADNADGTLTLTAKNKGECGTDIRVVLNAKGEDTPGGLTVTEGYLTGGTGNPDLTGALAALGDEEYDGIIFPWVDTASLDGLNQEMERRWEPYEALYPIAYGARRGTLSQLATVHEDRNDKFLSIQASFEEVSPAFLKAARYGAQATRALANHGARPLHTLPLTGHVPPPPEKRMTRTDRNTLLKAGVATSLVVNGIVQIDRAITVYQTNALGTPDNAFYDVTTPATLRYVIRRLRQRVESEFIATRCILVDDGTPVAGGVPWASPAKIRAVLIDEYQRAMLAGYVEREAEFEKRLIVSRDPDDPTRVNVRYTPDLANPLIVFATQVQFSLQWPAELAA